MTAIKYKPLKKDIMFEGWVKKDPSYPSAINVIKACGNTTFKAWLVNYLAECADKEQYLEYRSMLKKLSNTIQSLSSRVALVDESLLEECRAIFQPSIDINTLSLLSGMFGFLLSVQLFEREIISIDNDIEDPNTDIQQRLLSQAKREEYERNRLRRTFKK